MTRFSVRSLLAILLIICAGCATGAKPEAMTAVVQMSVHQSQSTVVVSVLGGSPTSAMWKSQISDEDFAVALRQSIEQSRLFAHVLVDGAGSYQLQAFIAQLNQPMFGASMTVSMEVDYTITKSEPKQVVWHKSIVSSYTAPFSAAFAGVTRLRLANEGAARKNIEQAILEMSRLRLE
jgi:hypothetical protein